MIGTSLLNINTSFINFHLYYTYKDLFSFFLLFLFYFFFLAFKLFSLLHIDNNIIANLLVTLIHIVLESYLLLYFTILRSFNNKIIGVLLMISAILIKILLLFLQLSLYLLSSFRFFQFNSLLNFLFTFLLLGFLGTYFVVSLYNTLSFLFALWLFLLFLFIKFLFSS